MSACDEREESISQKRQTDMKAEEGKKNFQS